MTIIAPRSHPKMGLHALLIASLALVSCFVACSATIDQAEMAEWARDAVAIPTAGPWDPVRRLLAAEQSKPTPLDCAACQDSPSPDKLAAQLGRVSFKCPKNDGQIAKALETHKRASALLFCCGKTLPASFQLGTSDKDIDAFAAKLTNKYDCTASSLYKVQLEKGSATLNEAGGGIKCAKPKTVYQCV